MRTSEYMFGDRHWILEKMPPAWRDNHKELIRSVSAEQRRIAALGTKTKTSTKPCPVPIPQDVEESDDEVKKTEAPSVDKGGNIRCHTCSSPVYKTPTCILDHFFGHYEKLYGVRRYTCDDCGFETNSSTIPRRCRGHPNHTRTDHLTEFPADCIFTTSRAVFDDPYAVLQWLPEEWKEDLITRIRGIPPKTAMKKALMVDPPDTDENCELALDERMCERVLRRLTSLEKQVPKAEEMKRKVCVCVIVWREVMFVYLLVVLPDVLQRIAERRTTINLKISIYYAHLI
ncbi:hypothetical protein WR25_23800 isoform B [Diploscapter pachys]|nr:hypothetical protein WR25_23800 isoform B [Diploscapter pachys]